MKQKATKKQVNPKHFCEITNDTLGQKMRFTWPREMKKSDDEMVSMLLRSHGAQESKWKESHTYTVGYGQE